MAEQLHCYVLEAHPSAFEEAEIVDAFVVTAERLHEDKTNHAPVGVTVHPPFVFTWGPGPG